VATIGLITQGAIERDDTAVFYQQLTSTGNITLDSMSGWFDSLLGAPDTQCKMGLYIDNAGAIGALVEEVGPVAISPAGAAIYTFNFVGSHSYTNGEAFWLGAAQFGGASGRLASYYDTGGVFGDSGLSALGTTPVINLPDPGVIFTNTDDIRSMFVTFPDAGGIIKRVGDGGLAGGTFTGGRAA